MAKKTKEVKAADVAAKTEQALIKFNDKHVLKLNYDQTNETLDVQNTYNGKSGEVVLGGPQLSFIPTITITVKIPESLGNETTLNLIRNCTSLIEKTPVAKFRLMGSDLPLEPGATGDFEAVYVYRNTTGTTYLAWADFGNLTGLTVEASDLVNCTRSSAATANINIVDETKDASITLTISAPAPAQAGE